MTNARYPRQQALQNPEITATVVHAILLDQYGEEVYDWDPVTIYLETSADFDADMAAEAMDKWCAMQVVMTSDAFFKRLDAFLNICNTLAEGSPAFDAFNKVTPEEAAWAIVEVALNREMLPFSYSIKKYLRTVLREEGFGEADYPAIFAEVFEDKPDAGAIRRAAANDNETNMDQYVDEALADMVSQFNKIPDLSRVDDLIISRGLDEALREQDKINAR